MSRLGYDGIVAALPVTIPYERYSTHTAHWWLGRALGACSVKGLSLIHI